MEKNNKNLNVPNLRFPEFSGEWEKYKLDEIATISKERIGVGMLSSSNYISTENMKSNFGGVDLAACLPVSGNVIKFQQGDTLLSNIRPYLKKIWQARFDGGCSADILVFRSNKLCNQDFLYYTLANEKFISYAMSGAKGVKMPRGDKEQMLKYELHLPTATEQNKITSLLSLLDQRIETQKKIIEKYESLIKGITDKVFYAPHVYFLRSFGTLYKDAGEGGTPSTSNPQFYENGTIPFIKIDDLSQKYLVAHKDCITELGLKNSSAWLIPTGSVIYSNGATIGAISINTYPVSTKQGILGIVPNDSVCAEYLYYLMTSKYFRKQVHRIITEGTMKTAYLKDINRILCPVPDKNEQQSLAKSISLVTRIIETEKATLEAFILQKRYLLSHLFI